MGVGVITVEEWKAWPINTQPARYDPAPAFKDLPKTCAAEPWYTKPHHTHVRVHWDERKANAPIA